MLITVILIGFSTYSHWASFAAVKGKVETFYNRTDTEIDTIIMMRFLLGIPCFFVNLLIAEHLELKAIILLASTFNAIGKMMISEHLNPSMKTWYIIILLMRKFPNNILLAAL